MGVMNGISIIYWLGNFEVQFQFTPGSNDT